MLKYGCPKTVSRITSLTSRQGLQALSHLNYRVFPLRLILFLGVYPVKTNQIRIGPDSWHYRVYEGWMEKTQEEKPTQENLCHYVQALCWAASYWFLNKNLIGKKFPIQPWMIAIVLWASIFAVQMFGDSLLLLAAFAVLIIGVVLVTSVGMRWVENKPFPLQEEIAESVKYIGTFDLFRRFAQAKMGSKICPFIVLPSDTRETAQTAK